MRRIHDLPGNDALRDHHTVQGRNDRQQICCCATGRRVQFRYDILRDAKELNLLL